jgi:hypothetical protein
MVKIIALAGAFFFASTFAFSVSTNASTKTIDSVKAPAPHGFCPKQPC